MTVPFEECVNISGQLNDNCYASCSVCGCESEIGIDSGELVGKGSATLRVVVRKRDCVRRLSSAWSAELADKANGAEVVVYYPTAADTLFGVAKKYRVSVAKLAADNDVSSSAVAVDSEDSLKGVERLVIIS